MYRVCPAGNEWGKIYVGLKKAWEENGRQGDLNRRVSLDFAKEVTCGETEYPTDEQSSRENPKKLHHAGDYGIECVPAGRKGACKQRCEDDRCGIIKEAFTLHQNGQAIRHAEAAEEGHDGNRVGGAKNGAEEQCHWKWEVGYGSDNSPEKKR